MTEPLIPLNAGQQAAEEAFFQFLFEDGKEFIIAGPAGTGKTHMMRHIIDTTIPRYQEMCKLIGIPAVYDTVNMTATTNKAAEALSTSCGRPTDTIHSFLNLTVKEDYDTGRTKLSKNTGWMVHEKKIIFVDEYSMIDSYLMEYLMEGTSQCKIVYVGDKDQLSPVMEKSSPVNNKNLPLYELTEPMRNSGQPALMDICQQLRETVQTGVFKPIKIVPGVIDLLDDSQMEAKIHEVFKEQTTESRILAYTNRRVIDYNDHIRGIRNLPHHYTEGENLINNTAIRIGRMQLAVEEEITLKDIQDPESVEIEGVEFKFMKATVINSLGYPIHDVKIPWDRTHYLEMLRHLAKTKKFAKYFDMKQTYPDIRMRDAATVHKAQGSTYETVFIDLKDISACRSEDQAARMLYVAFSRAKKGVYLYGELASKFGGLTT